MEVHEDADVGNRDDYERNADAAQHKEEGIEVLVAAVEHTLQTTGELFNVNQSVGRLPIGQLRRLSLLWSASLHTRTHTQKRQHTRTCVNRHTYSARILERIPSQTHKRFHKHSQTDTKRVVTFFDFVSNVCRLHPIWLGASNRNPTTHVSTHMSTADVRV